MNLTDRGKVYLFICFLSFAFSWLIVNFSFLPYLGLSLSFTTFLLFSYKQIKEKTADTKLYLAFSLTFSLLLVIRSEIIVTYLNVAGATFFGLMMLTTKQNKLEGFLDYIYAQFIFILKSVFIQKSDYSLEYKQEGENSRVGKIIEIVFGTLITLLVLVVVLPLLASANPYFQKMLEDIWQVVNLEQLFKGVNFQSVFTLTVRAAFTLMGIFMLPKILTLVNKKYNSVNPFLFKQGDLPLTIPKLVLTLVICVFFITQLQFYFASDSTLAGMGVSYSQRAREVFAQLTVVAGVVLALIYNDRRKKGKSRFLNWLLICQGLFLTLMAYKSAFDYINAWGFTYVRLYGLTFATWVTGVFILFTKAYSTGKDTNLFVKKTIIFSAVLLLLVNIFNFDYLIYHFAKSTTGQGIDYTYLSMLSADALSYKEQFTKLNEVTKTKGVNVLPYDNENPLILLNKIERLQDKYARFDIRSFNLLDFIEYQRVKAIDTNNLRSYYENNFDPQW